MEKKEKLYIRIGRYIAAHKALYYGLNYTWGLLGVVAGFVVFLFLRMFGRIHPAYYKQYKYYRFKHEHDYSFNVGLYVFCGWNPEEDYVWHEVGHSVQNAMFGPFMPFIVGIPSCTRYWWRNCQERKGKELKTGYYDIWFEASATLMGSSFADFKELGE